MEKGGGTFLSEGSIVPEGSALSVATPASAPAAISDWALFLDIDGTLLPHRLNPLEVAADEELLQLLKSVSDRLGGAVAFVTGRRLETVRGLFGPLVTHAAGLFGLEVQWNGTELAHSGDEPAGLTNLVHAVEAEVGSDPGLVIERKGPVLSLNTGQRSDLLERIIPLAADALEDLPKGYRVVAGVAGIELLPPDADKGFAIRRLMQLAPFKSRRPIFIGDDKPDEVGFAAINEMGGVSVMVRPSVGTEARYGLADVGAVRQWLARADFPDLAFFMDLGKGEPAAAAKPAKRDAAEPSNAAALGEGGANPIYLRM